MTCEKWFIWAVNMSSSPHSSLVATIAIPSRCKADLGHNQLKQLQHSRWKYRDNKDGPVTMKGLKDATKSIRKQRRQKASFRLRVKKNKKKKRKVWPFSATNADKRSSEDLQPLSKGRKEQSQHQAKAETKAGERERGERLETEVHQQEEV